MSDTIKRWMAVVEYKGTGFCGWQKQDHAPTIQDEIEKAIYAFCQQKITVHASGRTDAGVHALGQVIHFDLDYGTRALSGTELIKAINAHLRPHPISLLSARTVSHDFHARFGAKKKTYHYLILNRPAPPTFQSDTVWHVKYPLDHVAMHEGAQILLGHHDFTTFRDSQCQAKSPLRTLDRLDVSRQDDMICIEAEAQSFLHHQVRNFVGSLSLIGRGKWHKQDLEQALHAKDRTRGGPTAPAGGLFLLKVDYKSY